jgi:hypothetical protein
MNKHKKDTEPNMGIENFGTDTAVALGLTMVLGFSLDNPVLGQYLRQPCNVISATAQDFSPPSVLQQGVTQVIVPLFAQNLRCQIDAVSVTEALCAARFTGEVLVLAPPLLRPKMVEGELRNIARGMRLRIHAGALPPLSVV